MMTSCPMIALLFVVAAGMISHTEAANCEEDQHCSECDLETGYCQAKCHNGYYGLRCSSICSSQCKNSICEMTGTGIGRCTEGCKPGFQGLSCKIPCLDPGETCEKCPHACDGEFCNLGSSCIAGCNNSYYGSHCSICSRKCKSCNVKTRTCEECRAGHGGMNCLGGCEDDDCKLGCKPGFYGPLCVRMCSLHCRPNTNSNVGNGSSSDVTAMFSEPECERLTGNCVHGCVRGWYGSRCSSKCKFICRNLNCDNNGACIDGCIPGTYGTDCLPCPENCVNSTCHRQDGSCLDGCVKGFYGTFCTNTCESCVDGICNQSTGKCIYGCGSNCSLSDCMTIENCDPSMLHRSTIPAAKPTGTTPGLVSPSGDTDGRTSYIVMSTAALVVAVSVAVVSVVRKICKRRSNNKRVLGDHGVSPRSVHTSSMMYETLHRYWEISDDDVGAPSAAVITSKNTGDETDGTTPALADVFSPNADKEIGHNEIPEDLVWNHCSYSHFETYRAATVSKTKTRDLETRTPVRYLTPSEIRQLQRTTSLDHWPMQPSSGTKDTTVNTI